MTDHLASPARVYNGSGPALHTEFVELVVDGAQAVVWVSGEMLIAAYRLLAASPQRWGCEQPLFVAIIAWAAVGDRPAAQPPTAVGVCGVAMLVCELTHAST